MTENRLALLWCVARCSRAEIARLTGWSVVKIRRGIQRWDLGRTGRTWIAAQTLVESRLRTVWEDACEAGYVRIQFDEFWDGSCAILVRLVEFQILTWEELGMMDVERGAKNLAAMARLAIQGPTVVYNTPRHAPPRRPSSSRHRRAIA